MHCYVIPFIPSIIYSNCNAHYKTTIYLDTPEGSVDNFRLINNQLLKKKCYYNHLTWSYGHSILLCLIFCVFTNRQPFLSIKLTFFNETKSKTTVQSRANSGYNGDSEFMLTLLLVYSPAQQKHTFTLLYSFLPHHTELVYTGTAYYARRYRIAKRSEKYHKSISNSCWHSELKRIALLLVL